MVGFGRERYNAFFVAQTDPLIIAYAPINETKLINPLLYLSRLIGNSGIDGAFCQIDEDPLAIFF